MLTYYTDGLHMVTTWPVRFLHILADRLAIPRDQFDGERFAPHYNLLTLERVRAVITAGAKVIDYRLIVQMSRAGMLGEKPTYFEPLRENDWQALTDATPDLARALRQHAELLRVFMRAEGARPIDAGQATLAL